MCIENRHQSGITLIELIMFIVIVGVALAGLLASLNLSVKSSADPLQPKQALAIAEATLESILLKDYASIAAPAPSTPVSGYTATVTVTTVTGAIGGIDAKKITVSVTTPGSGSYTLTGYRTNY
jgi:MSHA pilin protein MshD